MSSDGRASVLEVGVVVAEAYEITHLLGKGGMGAVWAARHLRLPCKRVAIKVLLGSGADAQALARFKREAEVASRIGHAGIVEVLDFNQLADGTPYQVLEYLAGGTLEARLAAGPLPPAEALDVAARMARVLERVHKAGLLHRDVKPSNVGFAEDGEPKLLDFGLVQILSDVVPGALGDGPSDAAVVRPDLTSWRGLSVSCGMNPRYGDLDPYWMAASAIDEAVRNSVAVGADPRRIAILDNFCWGNCERPETLGSLVRAALACKDAAIASCRGSTGALGSRAGPSSVSSFFVYTGPIVGSPSSQVIATPSDQ